MDIREFFYFQRSDRSVIMVLTVLVVVACIVFGIIGLSLWVFTLLTMNYLNIDLNSFLGVLCHHKTYHIRRAMFLKKKFSSRHWSHTSALLRASGLHRHSSPTKVTLTVTRARHGSRLPALAPRRHAYRKLKPTVRTSCATHCFTHENYEWANR